jgi:hypothetical protein
MLNEDNKNQFVKRLKQTKSGVTQSTTTTNTNNICPCMSGFTFPSQWPSTWPNPPSTLLNNYMYGSTSTGQPQLPPSVLNSMLNNLSVHSSTNPTMYNYQQQLQSEI